MNQGMAPLNNGIYLVDAHYIQAQVAAIYLVQAGNEVAIIETGTAHSVPYIRHALGEIGLDFSHVRYVIPTHVHLDHAAGAGDLIRLCDHANLIIHPEGAWHMINPKKLIQGTIAVYGEKRFNELYGKLSPIDEERIIIANDGDTLPLGERNERILKFIDTKGHARHHFCVWDVASAIMFTGDTFGISYRVLDTKDGDAFILPTTTPVQFEPDELLKSIDKIMAYKPKQVALTHFSVIEPNARIVNQLKDGITTLSAMAQAHFERQNAKKLIEQKMMDYFMTQLSDMGHRDLDFCKKWLQNDVELNTQGLLFWQNRQRQSA